MPRRMALLILSVVLGFVWILVGSVPRLAGEEGADAEVTAKSLDEPGKTATPERAAGVETYTLAYKFTAGEQVHYEVVHEMEISTRYSEAAETAQNKTETRKHFSVTAVEKDGSADLELFIDWVRMSAKFGEEPALEFCSDDPTRQPAKYRGILKTIGKPQAKMRFSPSGKLLRVHNIASDAQAAASPIGKGAPAIDGEAHRTFLLLLPDAPIAIGETWKDKFEIPVTVDETLTQNVTLQRTCKLEKVADGQATISMKTAVLTPVNNPRISAQLIQREVSGEIIFDIAQGRILSRTANVDKSVIAPFGPKTAMHAVSRLTERLQPSPVAVQAVAPAATETK